MWALCAERATAWGWDWSRNYNCLRFVRHKLGLPYIRLYKNSYIKSRKCGSKPNIMPIGLDRLLMIQLISIKTV